MNPKVDFYFVRETTWREELEQLRELILQSELIEVLKWGVPTYTLQGHNVALLHSFKDYCALLFVNGALLSDPANLLVQQTENVHAARQLRFTSLAEIHAQTDVICSYVAESIILEQSGVKMPPKPQAAFAVAEEFSLELTKDPTLKKAFEALTPGRQRGYLLHFAGAKQAKTRAVRVQKCSPRILEGKGLDEA